jgi:ABC-2 type transport system ATP-binding protein
MIEVSGLTKYYGSVAAIKDVSFTVEAGEIVGFLGPNGAGKTTTMRILTCFFPPSHGVARVCGLDVVDDSVEVRRRVGYLPENVPLYGDHTVNSYLDFVAEVRGLERSKRRRRVGEVMERCGLEGVSHRRISTLSKGYRQRVGIAQALVHDPQVIILDEPTIGLDPMQIREIRELIRELSGQRTVIVSTHILPEVSMICTRALIINRGRIVAADTPENLAFGLKSGYRISMELESRNPQEALQMLQEVDGVKSVRLTRDSMSPPWVLSVEVEHGKDPRGELARMVVERGWSLLEMKRQEMTLEEVFLELVTDEPEVA